MLIINNRFLSLYDYNFLLVMKITSYDIFPRAVFSIVIYFFSFHIFISVNLQELVNGLTVNLIAVSSIYYSIYLAVTNLQFQTDRC